MDFIEVNISDHVQQTHHVTISTGCSALPSVNSISLQTSSSIEIPFDSFQAQLVTAEAAVSANRADLTAITAKIENLESDLSLRCETFQKDLKSEKSQNFENQEVRQNLSSQLAAEKGKNLKLENDHKLKIDSLTAKLEHQAILVAELSSARSALEGDFSRVKTAAENSKTAAERFEAENARLTEEKEIQFQELSVLRGQLGDLNCAPRPAPMADLMSQSCHPCLTNERPATPPTFERDNFQIGSTVYVVLNEETKQYILLSASRSIFYFVHESCLGALQLPSPAECLDKVDFTQIFTPVNLSLFFEYPGAINIPV